MAIDRVVDSTQLNSDLTSVANAIRTKGGTSGQLAFPAGFVSAVQAIPTGTTPTGTKQISISQNGTTTEDVAAYANAEITVNVSGGGGTNYLDYATKIVFGKNFPSATPDISLPLVTDAADMFYFSDVTCPYTSVKVTFGKQITSLARMFSSYSITNELTSVEINGDFSKVTQYQDFVKANYGLQEIKGSPLDFSSVTNANFTTWSGNSQRLLPGLTYVRYAENTLKVNHSIFCTALSDDSLVSIANGLQAGAHTLTLQTEMKNRLPLIMGTVANNGSYDVFTKDSQGSVTLQSFIATTKGWTIA